MTKQPELPEFYRDLEIVQSLNRPVGSTMDVNPQLDTSETLEMPDTRPT